MNKILAAGKILTDRAGRNDEANLGRLTTDRAGCNDEANLGGLTTSNEVIRRGESIGSETRHRSAHAPPPRSAPESG
jgi:hypothetical protein